MKATNGKRLGFMLNEQETAVAYELMEYFQKTPAELWDHFIDTFLILREKKEKNG